MLLFGNFNASRKVTPPKVAESHKGKSYCDNRFKNTRVMNYREQKRTDLSQLSNGTNEND